MPSVLLKPKYLLLCLLALLALLASFSYPRGAVVPDLAGAMAAAGILDALLIRYFSGQWGFPDGALLTGMFVGMILSPAESVTVAIVTSGFGVFSKYIFRTRSTNIFNPAALALVATFPIFNPGQNWWGATPEAGINGLIVLIAAGLVITVRVNKVPALLSFLGGYFLLYTLAAFIGEPAHVAEIFRPPDLQAALFLAFFMVTDPPTSPVRPRDQIWFGAIAAIVSFTVFKLWGSVLFMLAGLLVANTWEAWRRDRQRGARKVSIPRGFGDAVG